MSVQKHVKMLTLTATVSISTCSSKQRCDFSLVVLGFTASLSSLCSSRLAACSVHCPVNQ